MRLLSDSEKEAHNYVTAMEGLKGTIVGSFIGLGSFTYMKRFHSKIFKAFNPSVKSAMIIVPTIGFCSFYAEEGSRLFNTDLHSSGKEFIDDFNAWKNLPLSQKINEVINENYYKAIFGLYGCGLFAAKEFSMKKVGLEAQARAFRTYFGAATFLAISLLIGVSRKDVNKPKTNEWEKFLDKKD